jgi:hypothetical protein
MIPVSSRVFGEWGNVKRAARQRPHNSCLALFAEPWDGCKLSISKLQDEIQTLAASRVQEIQNSKNSKTQDSKGTQRTIGLAAATECAVLNYAAAPSRVGLSGIH